MGANAVTTVYDFTAGQVLTAAQMDNVNCGIPVFATTVTRDAAFGGTGEKVLAQGQMAFIEATNTTQYYNGSAWVTLGATGLSLIKAQTIGSAVSSVAVTSVFSSTYDNYRIVLAGGVASTGIYLKMTLGATATGYYAGYAASLYSGGAYSGKADNNATSWQYAGNGTTNLLYLTCDLYAPNLAKYTMVNGFRADPGTAGDAGSWGGTLPNTTQYTDFTLTTSSGTMTGGTIYVYGYSNS